MLKKTANFVFTALLVVLVAAPVSTLVRKKPTLAVTIRTWSMTPLMTRGDVVFILPTSKHTQFSWGQVIVFQDVDRGMKDWVMHRIVGGDNESSFITQGDANERTDQEGSGFSPIKPEWICGVVPALGPLLLKIPLLGYLPLWVEENIQNPRLLPFLLGLLAVALVTDEVFKSRKTRKKDILGKGQIYFLSGIVFAVLIGSLMLMSSLFLTFPYSVEGAEGILMGSDVGILEHGHFKEVTLATLKNEGSIPTIYCVVCKDPQVEVGQNRFLLRAQEEVEIKATVHGLETGTYEATVIVGMFMPFLPPGLIGFLVGMSFWLALCLVSVVPAIPLFILPYLDPRYQRKTKRALRRRITRLSSLFHP